jgi:DNA polymerase
LDSPNEDVRLFAEARVGIKSTIDESRLGRLLGMSRRGPATVYLKYSGAHTHRWSGGDKTNFQNLRRGGVLRDSLIAPEGKVIVACDSAAIEARGLAWLAGDADLMADFRVNADVYSKFASEIYGRPIDRKRKVGDTYPDYTEGFVGKTCILGLGYGMGWRKFALTMLAGPMGSKPIQFTENDARTMSVHVGNFEATNREAVQSITSRLEYGPLLVHCAVAKAIVDKYRRLRQPITKFWKEADQLIAAMASEITPQGYIAEFGEARFQVSRHAIKLPSGNVLKYDGLEGDDIEGYSYRTGFNRSKHSKIYGGSFTENLVQAFCRDIIAEQMIVLQAEHGYRPITMTHDEIVFLADESEALAAEKIAVTVMSTPPDWCSTLPLSAEAGSGKTYGET